MRVPYTYYIYFWLTSSMLSFGTGLIISLMLLRVVSLSGIPALIIVVPIFFPCLFILYYQIMLVSFFWGKRRGEFEYSFLEKSTERGKCSPKLKRHLKKVKHDYKFGDLKAANVKLKEASGLFPDNIVVLFKYALSCERVGLTNEAIDAYEAAIKLIPSTLKSLHFYIGKQIYRIKAKGPAKKKGTPGLQYVLY